MKINFVKMKPSKTFLALYLSLAFCNFLHAQADEEHKKEKKIISYDFALRLDYMFTNGTIRYEDWNTETYADFPSEGETNASLSPTISAGMEITKNHLFFGWNYVNIGAIGATQSPALFKPEGSPPVLIPKGTKMTSNINMNIYSFIWTRTVIDKKNHELGIGAGLMLIDYNNDYSLEEYIEIGEFSQIFPAPMISLHYKLDLERFELQTLIGGVAARINGNEIAYMNLDVAARYKIFNSKGWLGMLSVGLKYVPFYMSVETEEYSYENIMSLFGPFVGFRLKKFR